MSITLDFDDDALASLPFGPGERERHMQIELVASHWAGVMGRVNNVGDGYGCAPKGYCLRLAADGAYGLIAINGKAGPVDLGDKEHQAALQGAGNSGEKGEKQVVAGSLPNFDSKRWHNAKLRFTGTTITGFVDDAQVLSITNSAFSHGMAGLVTGDFKTRNTACFDNLLINGPGAVTPSPTVFSKTQTPIYNSADASGK